MFFSQNIGITFDERKHVFGISFGKFFYIIFDNKKNFNWLNHTDEVQILILE